MVHLGNICEINGAEIEKVDCITFGSPCQDVSVAGQRKGVLHEDRNDEETTRSGLFYEAMRIIKEMREDDINNGRTNDSARPRFGLLENVPGFPLAWARYNGAENCRWASEIEEFPIAVCKKHFGDEDAGIEGDIRDYL